MAELFDDLSWFTQGEAAARRKTVTDAMKRGIGPAAGAAVREGARATGGALAATSEMVGAPARAVGGELSGFYQELLGARPPAEEITPTRFGGQSGRAVAGEITPTRFGGQPGRAVAGRIGAPAATVGVQPAVIPVDISAPKTTDLGFGITKTIAPGKTTEYTNIDPTTGRPREYAAPYIAAAGTPTADWTKTAAYAEGVKRAERDRIEAALLDIGEAARIQGGAAGERERLAAIARGRLRLEPTGGAAARRAEVVTGLTEQQLAQAARLNQLQAQYLSETDPVKQNALAAQLLAMSGKATPEEFKLETIPQGEILGGPAGMPIPLKQAATPVIVGSRGTIRPVQTGAVTGAAKVAVGAKAKNPDGTYPLADGRKATVKGGVITEIK